MKKQSESGFVKIALAIVLLAVAAVAVYYFTSDVGQTRIDAAHKEYAKWTPKNIAKDPENYLNFCEKQCEKALVDLKASGIEIAQKRGEIKKMAEDAKTAAKAGEKLLGELKAAYSAAEESEKFPFSVASLPGKSFDQENARREIVSVHKQTESKKQLMLNAEAGLKQLDVNESKISDGRIQLQQQMQEITTSRTTLKISKITDELSVRLASIGGAIQATVGITTDASAPISLDSLVKQQAGEVDSDEFAKIMGL